MKEKNKKHKVWFALGIIVFVIYVVFTATRYSEHTLFTPFTGRVFDIDAEELACLTLKSGYSGENISYTKADELQEMTDYLKGFRYIAWLPSNPFPTGGWTYAVRLEFKDGSAEAYTFGRTWIEVKGVVYFSTGKYFDEWAALLDKT
jgi:hypothetical protein